MRRWFSDWFDAGILGRFAAGVLPGAAVLTGCARGLAVIDVDGDDESPAKRKKEAAATKGTLDAFVARNPA